MRADEILKATGGKLLQGSPETMLGKVSLDSRTIKRGEVFIAVRGDNFDGHDFIPLAVRKGAGAVVTQKATGPVPTGVVLLRVADTKRALGDIASCHRGRFDLPFVAVTGSNGKTTVKEMVASVLSARYRVLKNEGTKNNQIGLPLALLNLDKTHEAAVLEIGTNHPGEVKYLTGIYRPNIGVITNIGPSHLEHLGTIAGVFKEKYGLVRGLGSPSIAVLNGDEKFFRPALAEAGRKPFTVGFGFGSRNDFRASDIRLAGKGLEFRVDGGPKIFLNTCAVHNVRNALAAIAVARLLGVSYRDISGKLSSFEFPKGRMRFIKQGGLYFIDDTYNANPLSFQNALESLDALVSSGRKILVMGDMLELGEEAAGYHFSTGKLAASVCDAMIVTGKLSRLAAEAARACRGRAKEIFFCRDSKEARRVLLEKVAPGRRDIILVKGSRSMKMEEVFGG